MKSWKVSTRLNLIVALATVVMVSLVLANWMTLLHLSKVQQESSRRTSDAMHLRQTAELANHLYRIVADSYINHEFERTQLEWKALSAQVDQAIEKSAAVADTAGEKAQVAAAKAAMQDMRSVYLDKFLPLVRRDGPRDEVAALDERIDQLVNAYNDNFEKVAASTLAEAHEADDRFASVAAFLRQATVFAVVAAGLALVALALAVSRSITRQLGMEPAQAMVLAKRIADGDLSQTFASRTGDDSLASALAAMEQTLEGIVTQVRTGAESVATASAQIATGNQDLSGRTEQQASALQQTAATMEQLGGAVRKNADSASQANQLAQSASAVAVQGGVIVRDVVQTMTGISDSSRRIADIIGTIDGIAFQTNILALNAAVEAARAGEQGRGFAVVASEVRNLAQRSAEAAREIKALIGTSVDRVEAGSQLVSKAGETMDGIVSSIQRVSDIVSEITAASAEQSHGVGQVGQAVSSMETSTQQNAALVEQSAAAADSLNQQAHALVKVVGKFKLREGT